MKYLDDMNNAPTDGGEWGNGSQNHGPPPWLALAILLGIIGGMIFVMYAITGAQIRP